MEGGPRRHTHRSLNSWCKPCPVAKPSALADDLDSSGCSEACLYPNAWFCIVDIWWRFVWLWFELGSYPNNAMAHHAIKNHSSSRILQQFYHCLRENDRPPILGLTATPSSQIRSLRYHLKRQYSWHSLRLIAKQRLRGEFECYFAKPPNLPRWTEFACSRASNC